MDSGLELFSRCSRERIGEDQSVCGAMASEGAISEGPAEQDTCNSPSESGELDPVVGNCAQIRSGL